MYTQYFIHLHTLTCKRMHACTHSIIHCYTSTHTLYAQYSILGTLQHVLYMHVYTHSIIHLHAFNMQTNTCMHACTRIMIPWCTLRCKHMHACIQTISSSGCILCIRLSIFPLCTVYLLRCVEVISIAMYTVHCIDPANRIV